MENLLAPPSGFTVADGDSAGHKDAAAARAAIGLRRAPLAPGGGGPAGSGERVQGPPAREGGPPAPGARRDGLGLVRARRRVGAAPAARGGARAPPGWPARSR